LIDWSYDLLPEEERIFLRRLSVFSGGWSFEAGEGVAGQDGPLSFETLDLLTHLIDKSLVMVEESGGDEPARYRFLETIRQYAGEKLVESGESSAVRDRHLDFFDRFAQTADSNLHSQEQPRWLDRIELEHDNLRTALAWALEKDPEAAVRLAGAMSYFWIIRGYTDEARGWLARLLERMNGLPSKETSGMAARARLLFGYGWVLFAQGDNPGARSALRESAALARQVGDWHLLARVLNRLGMAEAFLGDVAAKVSAEESADLSRKAGDYWELAMAFGALANYALMQGNLRLAQGYLEESDKYFNQIGDPWNSAMALLGSAIALTRMGNFPEAKARLEKSLELFQKIGEKTQVNMARSELAHIERRQGNYEQAALLYRTTLPAWQNLGRREAVAHQLESIAFIAAAQGSYDQAAQLLGAAEALRDLIQIPMTPMEREEYDRNLADLRSHMEEQSFAAGWAKGRSMTMDEAIVCALELIG
jgi:non-specific serine/threonine protein kinase